MRRGHLSSSQQHGPKISKPPSPPKILPETTKSKKVDLLDDHFDSEEDNAWRAIKSSALSDDDNKPLGSSIPMTSTWRLTARAAMEANWSVESLSSKVTDGDVLPAGSAFGDNFAENLWKEYDGNGAGSSASPFASVEEAAPSNIAPLEES